MPYILEHLVGGILVGNERLLAVSLSWAHALQVSVACITREDVLLGEDGLGKLEGNGVSLRTITLDPGLRVDGVDGVLQIDRAILTEHHPLPVARALVVHSIIIHRLIARRRTIEVNGLARRGLRDERVLLLCQRSRRAECGEQQGCVTFLHKPV